MQYRIIFKYISGRKHGTSEVFPLPHFASELKIGRDPACEVRFDPMNDTAVSRHHASVQWVDGEERAYSIVDLLSSNGTFVNHQRVENAHPLKSGDLLEFGRGGPSAHIEMQAEPSFENTLAPATKTLEKVPRPPEK